MTDSRDVLTRKGRGPGRTLSYGEHPDQVIDVWPGEGPLVVVVHGGFWRVEHDRRHTYPQCAALAAEGYTVASVEYRRVGQEGGGWPGTFDDVRSAVEALPDLLGVGEPVLVGHSAGGHLALWVAWRAPGRVAGVVSLAGVCDLGAALRLDLDGGAAADLLGGRPVADERLAETDPVRSSGSGVRTILLHGDADDQVPAALSRGYADLARVHGDPVELRILDGQGHFGVIDPASDAWPHVVRAVRDLTG